MVTYKFRKCMNITTTFKIKKLFVWIKKKVNISIRDHFTNDFTVYIIKNIYIDKKSNLHIQVEFSDINLQLHTKDLLLLEYLELRYNGKVKNITYFINDSCPYIEKIEDGNITDIIMKNDIILILTPGSINLNNTLAVILNIEGGTIKEDIRLALLYKDIGKIIFLKINENGNILYSDISNMIGSAVIIKRRI